MLSYIVFALLLSLGVALISFTPILIMACCDTDLSLTVTKKDGKVTTMTNLFPRAWLLYLVGRLLGKKRKDDLVVFYHTGTSLSKWHLLRGASIVGIYSNFFCFLIAVAIRRTIWGEIFQLELRYILQIYLILIALFCTLCAGCSAKVHNIERMGSAIILVMDMVGIFFETVTADKDEWAKYTNAFSSVLTALSSQLLLDKALSSFSVDDWVSDYNKRSPWPLNHTESPKKWPASAKVDFGKAAGKHIMDAFHENESVVMGAYTGSRTTLSAIQALF